MGFFSNQNYELEEDRYQGEGIIGKDQGNPWHEEAGIEPDPYDNKIFVTTGTPTLPRITQNREVFGTLTTSPLSRVVWHAEAACYLRSLGNLFDDDSLVLRTVTMSVSTVCVLLLFSICITLIISLTTSG